MRRLFLAAAFCAAVQSIGSATAQVYPSCIITMVVPFPAGGSTDAIGRILSEHMQVSLGQPVVIENVGGAGGSTAVLSLSMIFFGVAFGVKTANQPEM